MHREKIIFVMIFLIFFFFLFNLGLPRAKAQTIEEILIQIRKIQEQIAQLQKQLAELQNRTTVWCHDFNINLRIGDKGSEVSALHTALSKEGFGAYLEADKVNSEFGEGTASAVTGFQQKYADEILTPLGLRYGTGFVGPNTRNKLNKLYSCKNLPPSSCQLLYWYDSQHKYCQGPKEFCGLYMYEGLKTFRTKEECERDLKKPSITVISPNGGEELFIGDTFMINWNSSNVAAVNIELEDWARAGTGGPLTWLIAENIPANLGSYNWKISAPAEIRPPIEPGAKYMIRIVNSADRSIDDRSDNYFTIDFKIIFP